MSRYRLHYTGQIILRDDGMQIPVDAGNWAYLDYRAWLDAGNTPDPADPAPLPDPQEVADNTTLDTLAQQYQTFKDGLTTIRGHMDQILAGPASPTATQTGTALKSIAGDIKTMCNGLDTLLDDMRVFVRRARG